MKLPNLMTLMMVVVMVVVVVLVMVVMTMVVKVVMVVMMMVVVIPINNCGSASMHMVWPNVEVPKMFEFSILIVI